MTLVVKSKENLAIAEYCRKQNLAICAGVNRAYYAAYQVAKSYLLNKGVSKSNYLEKASAWKVNLFGLSQYPFAHETIWKVVKGHMTASRKGAGLSIVGIGENLHKSRIDADYEDFEFSVDRLDSCIKQAKSLIDPLLGEGNESGI